MDSEISTQLSTAPEASEPETPSLLLHSTDYGSLRNHLAVVSPSCTIKGYEDLIWTRLPGFRVPSDDKKVRTWTVRDGHGWRIEKISDNTHWWVCRLCHLKKTGKGLAHVFKMTNSTSSAVDHMKRAHYLAEDGPVAKRRRVGDGAIDAFLEGHLANGADPVTAAQNEEAIQFTSARFKTLLYDWIITESISFRQLESPKLHALLAYLNPRCEPLIPSRCTVSDTIGALYDKVLGAVTEKLANAITNVNLSFDLWTSGNKLALLGVVASFISASGEPTTALLALPRQRGKHSGCNMAQNIGDVIAEFGLEQKIGYFITDNAFSNSTCLDHLANEFGFAKAEVWIRCSGHVLNLVAQAVLLGHDEESFERELADVALEELQLQIWRKRGPIGKLHNLVYWIVRSPQRNDRLMALQRHLIAPHRPEDTKEVYELVKDVTTRWNSFDDAAKRALYLRSAIDELMMEEDLAHREYEARYRRSGKPLSKMRKPPAILQDRLDTEDWNVIALYHEILQPVKKATIDLQGHAGGRCGAIWQVIGIYEDLLAHFEDLRRRYPIKEALLKQTAQQQQFELQRQGQLTFSQTSSAVADHVAGAPDDQTTSEHHFSTNINSGWQKLNAYYAKLDDSPVYVAAVVLHPRMKWRWLEKRWQQERPDWVDNAKIAFTRLSQRYRCRGDEATMEPQRKQQTLEDEDDVISDEQDCGRSSDVAVTIEQQLTRYLTEPRSVQLKQKDSPISWWLQQRQRWPHLSAMALDVFSTPVMSDEPERVFSEAGAALGTRRRSLSADTVKNTQCLRSWIRAGVIDWTRCGDIPPHPLSPPLNTAAVTCSNRHEGAGYP
jgi:hypothetical protein